MNVRRIALLGVLTSLTIVLSIFESFIPSIGIPGIKLGLANIVIIIVLYELGIIDAVIVNLLRVILCSLLRGNIFSMGFFMSFAGAFLSLGIMIIFYLFLKNFSIIAVSVIGSLFHVFGQILVAMIFLSTAYILYYLPIISLSAIVTGILVGITSRLIIKTKIVSRIKDKYSI